MVKNTPVNAGDAGSISGSERPLEEKMNAFQYSCLENPMAEEPGRPVYRAARSLTHLGMCMHTPCVIQEVLVVYPFYIQQCVYVNPKLPIYHIPPFPSGNCKFVSISMSHFCFVSKFTCPISFRLHI